MSAGPFSRSRAVIDHLLDAVLPVQCVGCNSWDTRLCRQCADLADSPLLVGVLDDDRRLPVVALGSYEGALRRIILAAKHSERDDLTDFLLEAGRSLGRGIAALPLWTAPERERAGEVWVVPAPPSWSRRLHGRSVTVPVARGVARGLSEASTGGARTRVVEAVGLRIGVRSQSGRGGRARRTGRRDSMRLRLPIPEAATVVLVDDVVTTGATARELWRTTGSAAAMACLARVDGSPGPLVSG